MFCGFLPPGFLVFDHLPFRLPPKPIPSEVATEVFGRILPNNDVWTVDSSIVPLGGVGGGRFRGRVRRQGFFRVFEFC